MFLTAAAGAGCAAVLFVELAVNGPGRSICAKTAGAVGHLKATWIWGRIGKYGTGQKMRLA